MNKEQIPGMVKKQIPIGLAVEGITQSIKIMQFLQDNNIPNSMQQNMIYTDTIENAEKARLLLQENIYNNNLLKA